MFLILPDPNEINMFYMKKQYINYEAKHDYKIVTLFQQRLYVF